jgi:hypothetical protein
MRAALLRVAPIAAAMLLAIDIVVTLAAGGNVGVAITDGVAFWSQRSTVSSASLVALAAISVVVLVAAFKFRANASARVRRVLVFELVGLCLAAAYATWVQLVLIA